MGTADRPLDASALRDWAHAVVSDLILHIDEINRLNVFPVADSDTGVNMLFTMRAAVVEADLHANSQADAEDVARVAAALAAGALNGARGNSGVILSQILRGIAEVTATAAAASGAVLRAVDANALGAALWRGVELVVASMGGVEVPGTIVSVLRAAAGAVDQCAHEGLAGAVTAAGDAAVIALEKTPEQLDVLADAGAVDAGGRGLLVLLDALRSTICGQAPARAVYEPSPRALPTDTATQRPAPQFEVMYLLAVCDAAAADQLRDRLKELGESVAIAAAPPDSYSVHVHTDDAGAAVEAGLAVGRVSRIVISALGSGTSGLPAGGWTRGRAVLAVVDGDGAAELFAGEGACVLRPGRRSGYRGRRGADRRRRCRRGGHRSGRPVVGIGRRSGDGANWRRRNRRRGCRPGTACARPPSRHRAGLLPHRTPRRRAADRGRVAVASLSDRLDRVLGATAADALDEQFGMRTVDDLLRHYPRSYVEGAARVGIGDARPEAGEHITIVDVITDTYSFPMKKKPNRKCLRITVGGGRNKVTATFFNADYIMRDLTKHTKVMLSGEVGYYKGAMQLTHPAFLILDSPDGKNHGTRSLKSIADASKAISGELVVEEFERRFFPIYPASTKVQSWDIFKCVRQVLDVLDRVDDPLPAELRAKHGLIPEDEALRAIHLAESQSLRERARERLTFDEAVGLQWALVARRHGELSESGPSAAWKSNGLAAELLRRLPFELTAGQREVLDVLSDGLAANRPLNRLLQGEVGSGKTIVAVLAMLQMVDAGYQCALLAPTEVLAAQHLRSIRDVLGPLAMGGQLGGAENATRVALLTGSMTAGQKKQVRAEIASGQVGIVIGTHALLQEAVDFHNLGMVVVDEQHRFGVEQRDQLRAKAPAGITPHLLVMTATPIPRTVALTVYGDLETSTLRELPLGRQPIATNVIFVKDKPAWLDRAWRRIIEEAAAGRQAYVVAPRIDESDDTDVQGGVRPSATAEGLFSRLRSAELAELRLALMHGRLSADDKDAAMAAFRAGEVDVLVCTTVIEVGVDVPNATVMLVMDADRFGISQLHQLRGRIGRGEHPSVCLLASWVPPDTPAGQRLRAVAGTMDGFALADLDLKERKEGDVLGRNQSGKAITLRLLSLAEHEEYIVAARDFCIEAYKNPTDPALALMAARFTSTDRIEYLDKS